MAPEQTPADYYKVVIRADKTPVGQHERQYNAPTIDEVAIVIVVEEFNSGDTNLYSKNGGVLRSQKFIAHAILCSDVVLRDVWDLLCEVARLGKKSHQLRITDYLYGTIRR
ncbi:hypothetical protein CDAR_27261 [Caerostris darwini]|uniref:Uncharacterized protein n=1 Tax=Caerostris darwini TaxID=1538125 RepID=A0AAV4QT60_9ARAC|nr:hypothetical protein CDAR_27261 [Caerostris darwini]